MQFFVVINDFKLKNFIKKVLLNIINLISRLVTYNSNKTININFSVLNTFIRHTQSQKIGKPNNLKVFGSNKTKEPKQDSQNQLRSPVSEGGEL
jgi:hypothetical protein